MEVDRNPKVFMHSQAWARVSVNWPQTKTREYVSPSTWCQGLWRITITYESTSERPNKYNSPPTSHRTLVLAQKLQSSIETEGPQPNPCSCLFLKLKVLGKVETLWFISRLNGRRGENSTVSVPEVSSCGPQPAYSSGPCGPVPSHGFPSRKLINVLLWVHYRVTRSRHFGDKVFVQVTQERMPGLSDGHVQTMTKQDRETLSKEVRKRAGRRNR